MTAPIHHNVKATFLAEYVPGEITIVDLAKKLGVSESTGQRWLREEREGAKVSESSDALTGGQWVMCPRRRIHVWQAA